MEKYFAKPALVDMEQNSGILRRQYYSHVVHKQPLRQKIYERNVELQPETLHPNG